MSNRFQVLGDQADLSWAIKCQMEEEAQHNMSQSSRQEDVLWKDQPLLTDRAIVECS